MKLSRHALAIAFACCGIAAAIADDEGATRSASGRRCPIAARYPASASSAGRRKPFSRRSTPKAASTAARSSSSRLDDAYSPPKTVEQTRKLVEQEEVLMMFGSLGTATNNAVHRYLNGKKVPQLFVLSGATKWADPKKLPVDDAGHGGLPVRRRRLCQAYPADQARRQNRHPVAERRFRPRLCRRLQARARATRPRP